VTDPKRWRCNECSWLGHSSELLVAQNPFDTVDTITGCPNCKSVGDFEEICDEAGCTQGAGCGFPTPDGGYRRTCFKHSMWAESGESAPTVDKG
jgi:hypothetical protein